MRTSHKVVIGGGCAAIVAVGFAAAPPLTISKGDAAEPTATTEPTASATSEPTATSASGGETFDGPAVSNARGTYQAQITVVDGVVTDVIALQAGTDAPESVRVNEAAIPALRQEVLDAQSADVAAISGASFTSPAFIESLEGAFEAAGLS
ncbi:FMN-binding protein [Demequina sp.]|uniref:FMN-binding protein n=1 Tax=Demequina sp. TaxID=2050685 RepID=UPI003D13A439